MSAPVDALVLCGGLGTRLRAVVADRPKALARIGDTSFLELQLRWLERQGIRRVVLSTGYMGEQVEAAFGSGPWQGIELRFAREPQPLGTAGAVRWALELVGTDPFLVLNGDSFIEVDLARLVAGHRAARRALTMVVHRTADTARYGRVETDAHDAVIGFEEKGVAGPGWINAGVYCMQRRVVEGLVRGSAASLERDVFPTLVGAGLGVHRAEGAAFLDIGTPEAYAQAQQVLAGLMAGGR